MANDDAVPVTLMFSPGEYGEVLAKLANELDFYCDPDEDHDASDDLKRAFAKLDAACPFTEPEIFLTTLVRKFRKELAAFYPANTGSDVHESEAPSPN